MREKRGVKSKKSAVGEKAAWRKKDIITQHAYQRSEGGKWKKSREQDGNLKNTEKSERGKYWQARAGRGDFEDRELCWMGTTGNRWILDKAIEAVKPW